MTEECVPFNSKFRQFLSVGPRVPWLRSIGLLIATGRFRSIVLALRELSRARTARTTFHGSEIGLMYEVRVIDKTRQIAPHAAASADDKSRRS